MVTLPAYRGRGISRALIAAIERRHRTQRHAAHPADRQGQPEAIRLSMARLPTDPVYSPYDTIVFSHCYARDLAGRT